MKFKAIIFDMDGTIVDTEHIWKNATLELIISKGVELTPDKKIELQERTRGLALHKSCAIIKDLANLNESLEELIKQKANLAHSMYKDGVRFIDGFLNFHNKLTKYELKKGIATNADDMTLMLSKEALKLETLFGQHIYSISCVNNICKPDPAIYLHAAQQLEIEPENCFAIEDSAHGITAAKKAGMFCIGINTAKNRDALKDSDLIIDSYDQIDLEKLLGIK